MTLPYRPPGGFGTRERVAADLDFEPTAHTYWLPDRTRVPSVTEILSATGIAVDFDALAGLSERLGEAIHEKRALGQALHADAHAYDDNDLDWRTVDPRVRPYLEAWATFRRNSGARPTTRERRVYHPAYRYAGTLDGVFLVDGLHILIDVKTGDPEASGCRYQLAAYQTAYAIEHPNERIHQRWAVQLCPDRQVPYRVTPYDNGPLNHMKDFNTFVAFVTTYYCQAARRRER